MKNESVGQEQMPPSRPPPAFIFSERAWYFQKQFNESFWLFSPLPPFHYWQTFFFHWAGFSAVSFDMYTEAFPLNHLHWVFMSTWLNLFSFYTAEATCAPKPTEPLCCLCTVRSKSADVCLIPCRLLIKWNAYLMFGVEWAGHPQSGSQTQLVLLSDSANPLPAELTFL